MDAENLKLAISLISALVAVAGAVVAHRARRQARMDLFETQRDLLLMATVENDANLQVLGFRTELLARQIASAVAATEHPPGDAGAALAGLRELSSVLGGLQRRDWNPRSVERMPYSEENLGELRRLTRVEQTLTKAVQAQAHEVLLRHGQKELEALQGVAGG